MASYTQFSAIFPNKKSPVSSTGHGAAIVTSED
jgi:hypothetical protein